ncbi:preprotein translocase subunit YajC [Shimazuella soli]|uniref:preprotein translocase subunit YajC n=1 Tax=Shimazuella soli TaxID=1892854 RepID=UPI0030B81115
MTSSTWSIVYIVVMFALLYFVLIRPQNKQRREQAQLLSALKKGDKVVTIGGLHGSIVDLNEQRVTLKVNDTTRLIFERGAIKSKVSEDTQAASEKKEKVEETPAATKEVTTEHAETKEEAKESK